MQTDTLSPTALQNSVLQKERVQSVDLIRGVVMVLMAIDHVRVYSGVPPGGPDVAVFLTRWVTHFCAPVFAFYAGTSAFLYGAKINDMAKLSKYLLTRGAMLVILEITLIRFFWAFNVDFSEFFLAGVIWMLGWCMILMAPLVHMRPRVITVLALAIISLQSMFAFVPQILPEGSRASFARVWEFVYPSGFESFKGVNVLYSIIPWIGVMAAGYSFGAVLKMEPERKRKLCRAIGAASVLTFIIGGSLVVLRTPEADRKLPFILELLNQRKYPASLLFLMMTIGPAILLTPAAEKTKGWISQAFVTIGKVPFFYYLLHIILIHASALVVHLVTDGTLHHDWFFTAPYVWLPEEVRWSLPLLYLVFAIDVVILYFACRWYAAYKASHPEITWLKYL